MTLEQKAANTKAGGKFKTFNDTTQFTPPSTAKPKSSKTSS